MALTADERTRSRYRYRISSEITDSGEPTVDFGTTERRSSQPAEIYLELPRGTVLRHDDYLMGDEHQQILRIVAKSEPVLTVRAAAEQSADHSALQLLRAAYHLGNRHVALEVGADYLRLSPDPVLEAMLNQLEVTVTPEIAPFQPETGAYGHHH